MVDAVLIFGLLNVLFEFVVLSMVAPRARLRVLGSDTGCVMLHISMLLLNLTIHWGTIIGTMSSILAFICSLLTVKLAKLAFGSIKGDIYRPGLVRYRAKELM